MNGGGTVEKRRMRMGKGVKGMTYQDILYEVRDGVAWVTINRPEVLNVFRWETIDELEDAFEAADRDPAVGVAVLTGAGDRAFCAGGDVNVMRELKGESGRE